MVFTPKYLLRSIIIKLKNGNSVKMPIKIRFGKNTDVSCKRAELKIGKYFFARENVHVEVTKGGILNIGENVRINRNGIIVCRKEITIGDRCIFEPNVCIYDHDHSIDSHGLKAGFTLGNIVIEENCWIGAGCIILKNTHIGEGSVIGAGCVVKGDIPAHSLVTMNRDLQIRALEERSHGEKN